MGSSSTAAGAGAGVGAGDAEGTVEDVLTMVKREQRLRGESKYAAVRDEGS